MPESDFLPQTVLIFGTALGVAWLFRMLRAPAVIGFLCAGMFIGQSGYRLIPGEAVSQFAELGLVLLLFTVGLELSPEPLLRAGVRVCISAVLQMSLTLGIVAFVLRPLGFAQAVTIGVA